MVEEKEAKKEAKKEIAVDAIVATTTTEQISIADAQRQYRRSPWKYVLVTLLVLLSVTVPYGVGRDFAVHRTAQTIWVLSQVQPIGWALLSWASMVVTMMALALATIESAWRTWGTLAYVSFVVEQFLSGFALFSPSYWWGTKVIFGSSNVYANGVNAGIMCSAWALGVFVVVYTVTLLFVPKGSRLNVVTRSWAAFLTFFGIQFLALIVAMFGGLI